MYLSPSQLCLIKRIRTSYARAHAHTRPRAYACRRAIASRSSTQTMQGGRGGGGGGCPCRLCPTCEERLRRAPLLTVLGTHRISRSFPLPLTSRTSANRSKSRPRAYTDTSPMKLVHSVYNGELKTRMNQEHSSTSATTRIFHSTVVTSYLPYSASQ